MADYRSQADLLAAQRNRDQQSQQSELFKALASQSLHGQQAMQQLGEKKRLDTEGLKERGDYLNTLLKDNPQAGASVTEQGLSVTRPTPDPLVRMQAQQSKDDQKNLNTANAVYNKALPKMSDKLDAGEKLMSLMNDTKNPISVGAAKSLLIRLHGLNRYNQEEAGEMLRKTLQASGARLGNFFGSTSNDVIDPSQREGIRSVVNDAIKATKDEHDMYKGQAQNLYQMSNTANPQTMSRIQALGQPMEQRFQKFQDTHVKPWQDQKLQQSVLGAPPKGAIASGIDRLKGFFTGQSQPQQAPQSVDPTIAAKLERLKQLRGQ